VTSKAIEARLQQQQPTGGEAQTKMSPGEARG